METKQQPKGTDPTIDTLATQRKLILSLEKVLRSYRLYEARGTQYESHVNELASHAALATELQQVAINLSPYGPFLEGEAPPSDGEFARQWFTLFEEGARQIVFLPGIDSRQLRELLHILSIEVEGNEDIVTSLWRKELTHIQLYVARVLIRDFGGMGDKSLSLEEDMGRWKALLQHGAEPNSDAVAKAPETQLQLSPDDFRVLALDEDGFDWCSLSTERTAEQLEQLQKSRVVTAVDKETNDFARFLDLATDLGESADEIILSVISGMTRMGNAEGLDQIICMVSKHEGTGGRSLHRLLDRQESLDALLPLFEASPSAFQNSLAAIADINADAIADLLSKVEQEDVREELQGFVATAEAAPMHYYALRLLSDNADEATEAVESLAAMRTDEAFILALEAYQSVFPNVRRLVMRKLFERYNSTFAHIVQHALEDIDKGIRVVTLRFIAKDGSPNLLRHVIKLMKQNDFAKRDYNERVAFVRAIGMHTRLPVINSYLCSLLLEYRIFSSKEMIDFLSEIARHLVRSPNPEAQAAVKKVLGRWSVPPEMKQAIRTEQVRMSHGESAGGEDTLLSDESTDADRPAPRIKAAIKEIPPPAAAPAARHSTTDSSAGEKEEEDSFELDLQVDKTCDDIPVVDYMAEALKIIADGDEEELE